MSAAAARAPVARRPVNRAPADWVSWPTGSNLPGAGDPPVGVERGGGRPGGGQGGPGGMKRRQSAGRRVRGESGVVGALRHSGGRPARRPDRQWAADRDPRHLGRGAEPGRHRCGRGSDHRSGRRRHSRLRVLTCSGHCRAVPSRRGPQATLVFGDADSTGPCTATSATAASTAAMVSASRLSPAARRCPHLLRPGRPDDRRGDVVVLQHPGDGELRHGQPCFSAIGFRSCTARRARRPQEAAAMTRRPPFSSVARLPAGGGCARAGTCR